MLEKPLRSLLIEQQRSPLHITIDLRSQDLL
ncbi:hypothetical protein X771_11285 [Mesorhizobium sp. LSJC277A00]|nr:hypothetical protein X771_11285 [Mesorhizobium sp. LSJC277A00]